MDKSEFRAMWEFLKGGSEELEAIREDFQRLDLDGNGYISRVSQENTLMFPGGENSTRFLITNYCTFIEANRVEM